MNIDAVKWLADYDKIVDFKSLGLTGKEFVLAYDINNPEMYEKLARHSMSLLVLDDGEFFARWKKKLEVDALLKKEGVPFLVVCDTVAKAIEEIERGGTNRVVGLLIEGKADAFCKAFVKEWERSNMAKFDLVVGNPPYDGTLHLSIHEKFQDLINPSGGIIWIHPNRVVIDHRSWGDYTIGKKYESFRDGLTNIHMFQGNKIFNIDNQTPLMVSVWRKDVADKKTMHDIEVVDDFYGGETYVSDAHHISKYGKLTKELEAFFNLAKDKDNLTKHVKGQSDRPSIGYICGFSGILGHITENAVSPDFYSIVRPNQSCFLEDMKKEDEKKLKRLEERGEDTSKFKKMEDRYSIWFNFNTSEDRENFIRYLKTKVVRFLLSYLKDDKHLDPKMFQMIPWMDFSRPYSDKDLCEMWNIDGKLWKYIDSYIPSYYNDWHYDGIYEDPKKGKIEVDVADIVKGA